MTLIRSAFLALLALGCLDTASAAPSPPPSLSTHLELRPAWRVAQAPRIADAASRAPGRVVFKAGLVVTFVGTGAAILSLPVFLVAGTLALLTAVDGGDQTLSKTLARTGLGLLFGGATLAAAGTIVSGFGLTKRGGAPPWFGFIGVAGFLLADSLVFYAVVSGRTLGDNGARLLVVGTALGVGFTVTQVVVNLVRNRRLPQTAKAGDWWVAPMIGRNGGGLQLAVRL